MVLQSLLLLFGLGLIIKGGDLFVGASVRIAEYLKVPRVVIGSTLVSLATTSPELVVSIMAGLKGSPGLALGNAVGSCVCNLGLILGATAALRQIKVNLWELRTALLAMFGFSLLVFVMSLNLRIAPWQGVMLIFLGLGYFVFDFFQHHQRPKPGDVREAKAIQEEIVVRHSWLKTRAGTAAEFILGGVLVVAGSKLLVDAAVATAGALGIPPIVIGLTVVAVGTSLPEFVTGLASSRRNVSDLSVGNILGANIANLTFIIGAAASLHEVSLSRMTQLFSFPVLLGFMLSVLFMLYTDRTITRREGFVLLAGYGAYIATLVVLAAAGVS